MNTSDVTRKQLAASILQEGSALETRTNGMLGLGISEARLLRMKKADLLAFLVWLKGFDFDRFLDQISGSKGPWRFVP